MSITAKSAVRLITSTCFQPRTVNPEHRSQSNDFVKVQAWPSSSASIKPLVDPWRHEGWMVMKLFFHRVLWILPLVIKAEHTVYSPRLASEHKETQSKLSVSSRVKKYNPLLSSTVAGTHTTDPHRASAQKSRDSIMTVNRKNPSRCWSSLRYCWMNKYHWD